MYELQAFQVHKGSPMLIEFLTTQSTVYSQYVFKIFKRKPFCKLSTIKCFIFFMSE